MDVMFFYREMTKAEELRKETEPRNTIVVIPVNGLSQRHPTPTPSVDGTLFIFPRSWSAYGTSHYRKKEKTEKRRAHVQMTDIQVQHYKNQRRLCLPYTSVTQTTLCLIFLMCVAAMFHYTRVDKNLKTICSLWFWHTCDLEIRSRSGVLVWIARPVAST